MRYMWICNPKMAPSHVRELLEEHGSAVVSRVFTSKHRTTWVFFTDYWAFEFARTNSLNDHFGDHWSVTSCNKQYVTNEMTGKYLGALAEVRSDEATAWVLEDDRNWFLNDPVKDRTWIPVNRNPNRLIPTGDYDGFCPHCGQNRNQPAREKHTPQYRPWPLHMATTL